MSSGKKEPGSNQLSVDEAQENLEQMRALLKESEAFFRQVSAPETAFRDTLNGMAEKIKCFDTQNNTLQIMLENKAIVEASKISEALQKYHDFGELYDVGTILSDPEKLEELNQKLKNEETKIVAFTTAFSSFKKNYAENRHIPEINREKLLGAFHTLGQAVETARQEVVEMVSTIATLGRRRSPAFDRASPPPAAANTKKNEGENDEGIGLPFKK